MKGRGAIYTLGTSDRGPEEFLELLRGLAVEVVVDVRRFPTSRLHHFRREELARLLAQEGLGYLYLGEELGGYRKGGYRSHLGSEEFRRGLEQLKGVAAKGRVAVLCAERLPWRCHRRFIGWELEREGWEVRHVIDSSRVWQAKRRQG